MAYFRILHISDLHFTKVLPESIPANLEAFLKTINAFIRRKLETRMVGHNVWLAEALAKFAFENDRLYDFVLVPGDLAATGEVADIKVAREFLFKSAARYYEGPDGDPRMNTKEKKFFVIPGNHDRFGRNGSPGNSVFDDYFGGFRNGDDGYWEDICRDSNSNRVLWDKGQDIKAWPIPSPEGPVLILIGADFTLKLNEKTLLPYGYLGQGRAHGRLVSRMGMITNRLYDKYRKCGCAILWVLHFDPTTRDWWLRLLETKRLKKEVRRLQARRSAPTAILCGHVHKTKQLKLGGIPLLICGSATQAKKNKRGHYENDCQILEVRVDPGMPPGDAGLKCDVYRFARYRDKNTGRIDEGFVLNWTWPRTHTRLRNIFHRVFRLWNPQPV